MVTVKGLRNAAQARLASVWRAPLAPDTAPSPVPQPSVSTPSASATNPATSAVPTPPPTTTASAAAPSASVPPPPSAPAATPGPAARASEPSAEPDGAVCSAETTDRRSSDPRWRRAHLARAVDALRDGSPSPLSPSLPDPDVKAFEMSMEHRDRLAASDALPAADGSAHPGHDTMRPGSMTQDEATRHAAALTAGMQRPQTTRILTVANQKGGVGKTTTTVNIAAALAKAGMKVLVVDTDPQGNASTALGIPHHSEVNSVYDVLIEDMTLREAAQECPEIPGLWCVPATIELAGAEIELVSMESRESRMRQAIATHLHETGASPGGPPDYILIDCPPSLGLLTLNSFVAGEEVLIPIQCEYYALEGLSMLLKNIEMIRRHLNPRLHVSCILLTMYDGRTRLSQQVADEVRRHFPGAVLRTSVPRSVRISEAPSHGQTVITYDPTSSGALSYLEAAAEIAAMK